METYKKKMILDFIDADDKFDKLMRYSSSDKGKSDKCSEVVHNEMIGLSRYMISLAKRMKEENVIIGFFRYIESLADIYSDFSISGKDDKDDDSKISITSISSKDLSDVRDRIKSILEDILGNICGKEEKSKDNEKD